MPSSDTLAPWGSAAMVPLEWIENENDAARFEHTWDVRSEGWSNLRQRFTWNECLQRLPTPGAYACLKCLGLFEVFRII